MMKNEKPERKKKQIERENKIPEAEIDNEKLYKIHSSSVQVLRTEGRKGEIGSDWRSRVSEVA